MDELLNIDLRLLLLRYGKTRVSDALTKLEEPTVGELESEIATIKIRKSRGKRKTVSAIEVAAEISRDKPECSQSLQSLAARYENRTFLPHLRDVHRFLERSGTRHASVRSRADAARSVFNSLSRLSADELRKLAESPGTSRDSDYALLAREIMGKKSD
jgi:hypothetical protein